MSKYFHSNDNNCEHSNTLHPSKMTDGIAILEPLAKDKNISATELKFSKSIEDLLTNLEFDVHAGKIWFGGQRMVLSHAHALWQLREDISMTLGSDIMQRLFFRYGYYAGVQDAEISKKLRPEGSWKL